MYLGISAIGPGLYRDIPAIISSKQSGFNSFMNDVIPGDSNWNTPAVFPFVYVQTLPGAEQGIDMQGVSVNAGMFSFQIDVYSNKTQTEARNVMSEVRRIMKEMGFECNQMPSFENTKDVHRMTSRFRRLIGACDKL